MAESLTSKPSPRGWQALFAAWLLAVLASLAVLFVGEVMGQTPCNLCWFQRAFMFPLVFVLGVGAWRSDLGAWRYGLPVALTGGLVAAFHTFLYIGVIPERISPCSQGVSCASADMTVLGGLPLPALALLAFAAIAALLLITRSRSRS